MHKKNIVKDLNEHKPNKHAELLIKQCSEPLQNWISPYIFPAEQDKLEEVGEKNPDAKIVIHADGRGATVLSSTGSITIIGNENVRFPKSEYEDFGKHRTEQTNSEFNYAIKRIGECLKTNGVFNQRTKIEMDELDKVLPHVIIMTTASNEIVVADAVGHRKIYTSR